MRHLYTIVSLLALTLIMSSCGTPKTDMELAVENFDAGKFAEARMFYQKIEEQQKRNAENPMVSKEKMSETVETMNGKTKYQEFVNYKCYYEFSRYDAAAALWGIAECYRNEQDYYKAMYYYSSFIQFSLRKSNLENDGFMTNIEFDKKLQQLKGYLKEFKEQMAGTQSLEKMLSDYETRN